MTPAELWALELDKAASGVRPAGPPSGWRGWWAMFKAATPGALAWLATALLFARDPSRPPAGPWAALHGELENRTRPLLDLVIEEAPATPILLLGRPQRSLAAVRALFAGRGLADPRLFRPWTLADALATFGTFLGVLGTGFGIVASRPAPPPPVRDLTAIVYRIGQGLASRRWGRREGSRAGAVVFGHTGLADASLLELGLQAAGARTIHFVHGVSKGWDFTGISSRAIFQCDSDARWHRALGGYGEALALPAAPPPAHPRGEGWLLLSNRAHPMDPAYQSSGLAAELALLDCVALAADLAGQARSAVTWRPHPVFASLPQAEQSQARAACDRLGLRFWDPAVGGLEGARDFRLVITSPSTAAIDMLRLGKLPVVLGAVGDPASALAQFPCRATDAPGLAALARDLDDPRRWRSLYDQAWTAVGPGRKPRWADLIAP